MSSEQERLRRRLPSRLCMIKLITRYKQLRTSTDGDCRANSAAVSQLLQERASQAAGQPQWKEEKICSTDNALWSRFIPVSGGSDLAWSATATAPLGQRFYCFFTPFTGDRMEGPAGGIPNLHLSTFLHQRSGSFWVCLQGGESASLWIWPGFSVPH